MIIDFFTANFWATCTLVASFVTMVTIILIKWLKPNGVWKQVISWVVSIGLTVGCYFAGIITVASPIWLTLILTGLVVGIASNGIIYNYCLQ